MKDELRDKIVDIIYGKLDKPQQAEGITDKILSLLAPVIEKAKTFDKILGGNCNACPIVDFCMTHDGHPCEMLRDALTVIEKARRYRRELENIANANYRKWGEGMNTAEEFVLWAQNRARQALTEKDPT